MFAVHFIVLFIIFCHICSFKGIKQALALITFSIQSCYRQKVFCPDEGVAVATATDLGAAYEKSDKSIQRLLNICYTKYAFNNFSVFFAPSL